MRPLAAALLLALAPAALRAGDPWRCPPCSARCDAQEHAAAGRCPTCGMALVKASEVKPRKRVAILVFDGVQIIDYTGPYEVFGEAGYEVFTVAEKRAPVTTAMGMEVVPAYGFADCPPADVVVVPGGGIDQPLRSAAVGPWIRAASKDAKVVMSVCTGAFLLAKTGLLDGREATTVQHALDTLQAKAPQVKVVRDRRWTESGKFVATAGLSSGIDGAFHVVERLEGRGRAQAVALGMEYDWRPEGGWTRGALADLEIPDLEGVDGLEGAEVIRTEGGRDAWRLEVRYRSARPLDADARALEQALAAKGWAREARAAGHADWRFTGRDRAPWKAATELSDAGPGTRVLRVEVRR